MISYHYYGDPGLAYDHFRRVVIAAVGTIPVVVGEAGYSTAALDRPVRRSGLPGGGTGRTGTGSWWPPPGRPGSARRRRGRCFDLTPDATERPIACRGVRLRAVSAPTAARSRRRPSSPTPSPGRWTTEPQNTDFAETTMEGTRAASLGALATDRLVPRRAGRWGRGRRRPGRPRDRDPGRRRLGLVRPTAAGRRGRPGLAGSGVSPRGRRHRSDGARPGLARRRGRIPGAVHVPALGHRPWPGGRSCRSSLRRRRAPWAVRVHLAQRRATPGRSTSATRAGPSPPDPGRARRAVRSRAGSTRTVWPPRACCTRVSTT